MDFEAEEISKSIPPVSPIVPILPIDPINPSRFALKYGRPIGLSRFPFHIFCSFGVAPKLLPIFSLNKTWLVVCFLSIY